MKLTEPIVVTIADPPGIVQRDTSRAEQVIEDVVRLDRSLSANQFELGDLFAEIADNDYFHAVHCQSLPEFLTKSGIDLSPREVAYRVKVSKVSKKLRITRDQLLKARISKVKAIFELDGLRDPQTGDPRNMDEDIRRLILEAPLTKLSRIKEIVKELRGDAEKDDELVTENVTYNQLMKANVDRGIDLVRLNYGSTIDPETKQEKELSRAACYELMAVEYWNDPNHHAQDVGEQGTFEDEFTDADSD